MRCRESVVDLVCLKRGCKVKLWAGHGRVSGQGGGKNLPRFAHRWPARFIVAVSRPPPLGAMLILIPVHGQPPSASLISRSRWLLSATRQRLAQRGARADGDAVA